MSRSTHLPFEGIETHMRFLRVIGLAFGTCRMEKKMREYNAALLTPGLCPRAEFGCLQEAFGKGLINFVGACS